MQKAFVIQGQTAQAVKELNEALAAGAKVVSTCAMPSSLTESSLNTTTVLPTCLVVVELRGYPCA